MHTTTRHTGTKPRQDLSPLLDARSVAIVGISELGRFGGELYRNLEAWGYAGEIYGINPRRDELFGRPCYDTIHDLPQRPDCVLLAVPNARLLGALEEAAACAVPAAVIFANALSDEDDTALQEELARVAQAHGMVVCGPNCMGFVAPGARLSVSGYETNPEIPTGHTTLITHSGSVWEAFLQNQRSLAFNYIVSAGNEMVTTMADYMQFALADETTHVIGLFVETVRDPDTFKAALALAAERDVPVVALKTGRSARGAQLSQAHSGALAGEDGAYDALFDYYGVRRVHAIDEMMDTLELFASGVRPATAEVAALLDSGGQRALLVDLAEAEGVEFAKIGESTSARLAAVLDPGLEPTNPLDAWGTGNDAEDIFVESLLALDADPGTGLTLFAVDLYPSDDEPPYYPTIAAAAAQRLTKALVFLVHLSAAASVPQTQLLRAQGHPVLMGTETGLRALRHLISYDAFQRARARPAPDAAAPIPRPPDLAAVRKRLSTSDRAWDEYTSKALLREYGLSTVREHRASTQDAALEAAREIGYPVVLKTAAGELHKSERDGVRLQLAGPDALSDAYRDFAARLGPEVLVSQMVEAGVELLLGVVDDPQFGPLLTLGLGGIFVELLKDVRMLMLPTSAEAVEAALAGLRGAALLDGVRGRPPVDREAVVRSALGLAALALDLGDSIAEIDVNPLIARPDGAIVVDALIVPKPSAARPR